MLIGIGHKKNSGKDTFAKILHIIFLKNVYFKESADIKNAKKMIDFYDANRYEIEDATNIRTKAFSDKLKTVVADLVGLTVEQINEYKNTNEIFPFKYKGEDITYRKALQLIGTELFRDNFPGIWINAMFLDYNPTKSWLITDVRFRDEADKIKELGGIVINIDRPSENIENKSDKDHSSESQLEDFPFDYTVPNTGKLENLIEQAYIFLNHYQLLK